MRPRKTTINTRYGKLNALEIKMKIVHAIYCYRRDYWSFAKNRRGTLGFRVFPDGPPLVVGARVFDCEPMFVKEVSRNVENDRGSEIS